MVDQPGNHLQLEAWFCESTRLTVFPLGSAQPRQSGWWEQLVGTPPEQRQELPLSGEVQEIGPFEGHQLTVATAPLVMNVILRASPGPVLPWGSLTFANGVELLRKLTKQWFEVGPPVWRIALGLVVLSPVESRRLGYKLLQPYLSTVKLDPETSSDFFYQINRRRRSRTISSIEINRLSKWSVAEWQQILLPSHPQAAAKGVTLRVELDINTAPEHQSELPRADLDALSNELVDLGVEILKSGDIP